MLFPLPDAISLRLSVARNFGSVRAPASELVVLDSVLLLRPTPRSRSEVAGYILEQVGRGVPPGRD